MSSTSVNASIKYQREKIIFQTEFEYLKTKDIAGGELKVTITKITKTWPKKMYPYRHEYTLLIREVGVMVKV